MARLSNEKINEIRQSVDIVDVIGSFIPLTKKGRNYVGICPFHDDTNPSMSISPEKQIYHCFVCGAGGNVFKFLEDYQKISFIEAVKEVADMGNIDVSEYTFNAPKKAIKDDLVPLYQMHEKALEVYKYYLSTKDGVMAKEYLTSRNMSDEIIDYFQIGYAPSNNYLTKTFEKNGFKQIDMYKSGLIIEGGHSFDRFSDRIMFPLHDVDGKVVGFSGRIYKQSQTDSKYMNSPESQIFIKGENLYNYYRAKKEVRTEGKIIICEGFMDVIALYKAGFKNVVAIMGTALTKEHIKLIKRVTKEVVMCLDGDNPGQVATIKCLKLLEENGIKCYVAKLPEGKDPDEVINDQGINELKEIISKALNILEFKIEYYFNNSNMANYDDRKKYMSRIADEISKLDDEVDIDHYCEELATRSKFDKSTILSVVNKDKQFNTRQTVPIQNVTYQKQQKILNKYERAENELLYYMMQDKKYFDIFKNKVGFMSDDINKLIYYYILDVYERKNEFVLADELNNVQDKAVIDKIILISQDDLPDHPSDQAIDDYIKLVKENAIIKPEIDKLKAIMENTQDVTKQSQLVQEIVNMSKKLN
ncbi:MAG: DNA primase [Thomasclavelia sp.]|jgi:DNA primase|nr:DNA primase [Thomasclavelia sp.]